MSITKTSRTISAPIDNVFQAISDINLYAQAIPHIVNVEILSEQKSGLGTRFRETRHMDKRQMVTELEITEYKVPHLVRFVSDEGGTVWDTVFTFEEHSGKTIMNMSMEAKPHKLLARLMNLVIKGFVQKAIEADMDAVKEYCEAV